MIITMGTNGAALVGSFMLVAALLSMFVMNTSTTLMLLPIGLAVCTVVAETIPNISNQQQRHFDTALMLVLHMLQLWRYVNYYWHCTKYCFCSIHE